MSLLGSTNVAVSLSGIVSWSHCVAGSRLTSPRISGRPERQATQFRSIVFKCHGDVRMYSKPADPLHSPVMSRERSWPPESLRLADVSSGVDGVQWNLYDSPNCCRVNEMISCV